MKFSNVMRTQDNGRSARDRPFRLLIEIALSGQAVCEGFTFTCAGIGFLQQRLGLALDFRLVHTILDGAGKVGFTIIHGFERGFGIILEQG